MSKRQNQPVVRQIADYNVSHPVKNESSKQPRSTPTKRRSRSAGPKSKPRNSMGEKNSCDNRDSTKPRLKSKQGLTRHSMYSEHISDDSQLPDVVVSSSGSTDSEAERQRWNKNPLIMKRVRKGDKKRLNKSALDNSDNQIRTKTSTDSYNDQNQGRNLFIYQDKNTNPQSYKNKFQKLEERRKQRVDIMVTSDEEMNSPENRISRLRQRALQGSKLATHLPDRLEDLNMKRPSPNSVSIQAVALKRLIHVSTLGELCVWHLFVVVGLVCIVDLASFVTWNVYFPGRTTQARQIES